MSKWHGIMRVLEFQHISETGEIIEKQLNLNNTIHLDGEKFILDVLFTSEQEVPENYYLGLDNRSSLSASQTIDSLSEPLSTNGYERQPVASNGEFSVSLVSGVYVATGPIIVFTASGGSIGPVKNLFITNEADDSGVLIASVRLTNTTTLSAGQSFSCRMGFTLQDA